jgi:hypothetical protein
MVASWKKDISDKDRPHILTTVVSCTKRPGNNSKAKPQPFAIKEERTTYWGADIVKLAME